jgi:hypothetical protein
MAQVETIVTVWERNKFPVRHTRITSNYFFGKGKTLSKPYCWTPTKPFTFGGKRFIALYPCMAFETKNFGFICQKLRDRVAIARE